MGFFQRDQPLHQAVNQIGNLGFASSQYFRSWRITAQVVDLFFDRPS
jgi:hypothetical protein